MLVLGAKRKKCAYRWQYSQISLFISVVEQPRNSPFGPFSTMLITDLNTVIRIKVFTQ